MSKFTLYWLDGKKEVVTGDTIADAMTHAGYGGGAVKVLDFFEKGINNDWEWKDGKWTRKKGLCHEA